MKKYFLIFAPTLIIAFNLNAASSGICGDNYDACHYVLSDDGILIIDGNGAMNDYDIQGDGKMPWGNEVKEVKMSGITSIGKYAFYNTIGIHNIIIPKTVEKINEGAFAMTSLKDVIYETDDAGRTKLTTIGRDVFAMTNLKNMTIPDSVTDIGQGVFYRDKKLENIVIPDSVTSLGIYLLTEASQNAIIYCHNTSERSCADLINENNSEQIGKLKLYTKEKASDGVSDLYKTEDGKFYATLDLMGYGIACDSAQNCQDILNAAAIGNTFIVGGKFYSSLNDLALGNYIKKRIYTLEEAERVSKPTGNTFKLRYK
ncbi:MAG: leucine-rich repeat domain-containing protein [Alphaproteobacteria bacterium]|nr:leucine-rich repeat domain-containing protein [Alphaproteobacteria bacterium]